MVGEKIIAVLTLRKVEVKPEFHLDKNASPAVNKEKLRTFLKDRLAPYKHPKEIIIVEEIPRNALGKVSKLNCPD